MKIFINKFILSLVLIPLPVFATQKNAEDVYFQTCYVCHGDNGSGSMPGVPDLSESENLFTEKEDDVVARIKEGIQTPGNISMPPKGGNPGLTDEDLLSVLRYVKTLVKND